LVCESILQVKELEIVSTSQQVFAFRIGMDLFCFPLGVVREVLISDEKMNKESKAQTATYNNTQITLLDITHYADFSPKLSIKEALKQLVIVDTGAKMAGIFVDECCGVFTALDAILDASADTAIHNSRPINTTAQLQLRLIDVESILTDAARKDRSQLRLAQDVIPDTRVDPCRMNLVEA
jgi:chemotaxis signal transduction protein